MTRCVIDTRLVQRGYRHLPNGQSQSRHQAAQTTHGISPSIIGFGVEVERLFRTPYRERATNLARVTEAIRTSRYPVQCINKLIDEAVSRGGLDGLELAATILEQLPVQTFQAAKEFFRSDSGRRSQDRKLSHPRYRVSDEAWSVLLVGLARSSQASVFDLFALLSRVAFDATDGMREGIANAARELAGKGAQGRQMATILLRWMLSARPGQPGVSRTSRETIQSVIDSLE